ncbi:MAG: competence/damage-inducible protein CinA [Candidatus Saganbacteria bacterium]|uniref:Competence/damage-inducible protein CinA n=1 Tax=Candidatus Saganbacteria bacterium TaxID=2575572 RepID=A0A833L221_UNCSA|nr:MAG: competence/damage-inducible protein CinA [Candidatus Saganbacteria bacterium]
MSEDKIDVSIEDFFSNILESIGKISDDEIFDLLSKSHKTISTAESVTGGLLSSRLTAFSGSSNYFIGGIISYHSRIKVAELMIPGSLIAAEGPVSSKVACAMAEGIKKRFKTDFGLSTTGCAGPLPLQKSPVGLVYIAIASEKGCECKELHLAGTRGEIRERAAQAALGLLWIELGGEI